MTERLATHLWVTAGLRRCDQEGVAAYLRHKGEKMGGTVILKLDMRDKGARILTQSRDMDGRLAWFAALGAEPMAQEKAEDYIARALQRDPDVWIVEIEHPEGWHPFEGEEIGA